MRLIINYMFALLLGVGIAAAQPAKTVCYRLLGYESSASVSPAHETNLADRPDQIVPWSALGYRLVRSCATAQLQIENEMRLVGPPSDPESKVNLTLILRVSGMPPEKISIRRLRLEETAAE